MISLIQRLAPFVAAIILASCASSPSSEVQASARKGVTVVASERCAPRYISIGTTVLTNQGHTIKEPGFSYPDFLAQELERRGYPAKVSDKPSDGANLILTPMSEAKYPAALGGGIYRRSFFGASSGLWPFCNFTGKFSDKSRGVQRSQPWPFLGSDTVWGESEVDPPTGSWSALSADDIRQLREANAKTMKEAADAMLSDLGL